MSTNNKELSNLEKLEPILIDSVAIGILLLPFNIPIPETYFGPIFILTIFYGLHNTHTPKNEFAQLIYGFLLIGAMLAIAAVAFLMTGSLIGSLVAIFVIFPILLIKGDGGKVNPFTKLYEHPIRIILIPILFSLFLQGAETILTLKVEPSMAIVMFGLMFLPIRILITFDRPQKFYHVITLVASLAFYAYSMYQTITTSPTAIVWEFTGRQENEQDFMVILEQSDTMAVVEAHSDSHYNRRILSGYLYYLVCKKNTNQAWEIDLEATRQYYNTNKLPEINFINIERKYKLDYE